MSVATKYGKMLQRVRRSLAYWSQITKRDFTDDLLFWMRRRNVNQARLAELLDVSPQFVTKVLRTNANLTIETMAKIALALGCQVRIHLAARDEVTVWRDYPDNITRDTWLGSNIVPIYSAKSTAHGTPEPPQTIDLPSAVDS